MVYNLKWKTDDGCLSGILASAADGRSRRDVPRVRRGARGSVCARVCRRSSLIIRTSSIHHARHSGGDDKSVIAGPPPSDVDAAAIPAHRPASLVPKPARHGRRGRCVRRGSPSTNFFFSFPPPPAAADTFEERPGDAPGIVCEARTHRAHTRTKTHRL